MNPLEINKAKKWETIHPHPDILEILFRHRKEISDIVSNVLGLHSIDYISVEMVDPDGKWVSFTSNPSMLYNLMEQNLWFYEQWTHLTEFKRSNVEYWESNFHTAKITELIQLKQKNYGYTQGFLYKKWIHSFFVVYSFATKSPSVNFHLILEDLVKMGDFCLIRFQEIYNSLGNRWLFPGLMPESKPLFKKVKHLRLIQP